MFKKYLPYIFSPIFFQKIVTIILFAGILYILRDFLPLFFITFIFAYLFHGAWMFLSEKIREGAKKHLDREKQEKVRKFSQPLIIITLLYIIFTITVIFLIVTLFPKIISELEGLISRMPNFILHVQRWLETIEQSTGLYLGSEDLMNTFFEKYSIQDIGKTALNSIRDTGGILLKFTIGIILSYVFVVDRYAVNRFFSGMKQGNFAFLYHEFSYLAEKIGTWFGQVFKAQSIIAVVNAVLTAVGLIIIGHLFGHHGFPYIIILSTIVFIFWFIPVFGTFLSGAPILLIGYGFWWIPVALSVMIMITIIHGIEAYILNPKIVSSYIHFPVFVTLLTLLIGEHIFWFAGLLIAIPILYMIISIGKDIDKYIGKVKKNIITSEPVCPLPVANAQTK